MMRLCFSVHAAQLYGGVVKIPRLSNLMPSTPVVHLEILMIKNRKIN